jgi:hypothetical protein
MFYISLHSTLFSSQQCKGLTKNCTTPFLHNFIHLMHVIFPVTRFSISSLNTSLSKRTSCVVGQSHILVFSFLHDFPFSDCDKMPCPWSLVQVDGQQQISQRSTFHRIHFFVGINSVLFRTSFKSDNNPFSYSLSWDFKLCLSTICVWSICVHNVLTFFLELPNLDKEFMTSTTIILSFSHNSFTPFPLTNIADFSGEKVKCQCFTVKKIRIIIYHWGQNSTFMVGLFLTLVPSNATLWM